MARKADVQELFNDWYQGELGMIREVMWGRAATGEYNRLNRQAEERACTLGVTFKKENL